MIRISCKATLLIAATATMAGAEGGPYATPQDALDALVAGFASGTPGAVAAALGPGGEDLVAAAEDDAEVDEVALLALAAAYREGYRFVPLDDASVEIVLGADDWPFPVPLVRGEGGWRFDTEAGLDEIGDRVIGANELDVIEILAGYLALQEVFRLGDPDGDGVREYAAAVVSSEGARDGLYWPGGDSLVGDIAARASLDGIEIAGEDITHEPLAGYYFRILTGQTEAAPGGAMSYVVNGHMLAGHALLAVPAEYDETGIHTFLVSANGTIWEADLGPDTREIAFGMEALDPDPARGWAVLE